MTNNSDILDQGLFMHTRGFVHQGLIMYTGVFQGTVPLGCNEVNGPELKFQDTQGFVTDKVLYNMHS